MGKHGIEDNLIEFKPRVKGAIWGVKNYNYRAVIYDKGIPKGNWEKRYGCQLDNGKEVLGKGRWTNDLNEAKDWCRMSVKGRAFRSFIRRMG